MTTTIRVDREVYERLVEIRAEMMRDTGRPASFSDALWRALDIKVEIDTPYADKPKLRKFFEAGYHARVVGDPRTYPGAKDQTGKRRVAITGDISRRYRDVWLEGWDLADERAKGHKIEEVSAT